MIQLLGLVLVSFVVTSFFLVPFIDLLFYLRRKYKKFVPAHQSVDTPIHTQLKHGKDVDTPVGGGLMVIFVVVCLGSIVVFLSINRFNAEILILIFTLLSFGSIGFIDDFRKIFAIFKGKYIGLRGRHIILLQTLFALIVSLLLFFLMGINNIYIPLFGNVVLDLWYIPLAVFSIVSFSNAYNISDGLDGLSTGLLTICLVAFLVLANSVSDQTLRIFIGVWLGSLLAYLYFNVYPARIYLGDAGAYGFGATLAVVGLLTGKILGLGVIGGVYVVIVLSSLLQIISKRILGRKILPVSPIHMYFRYLGWEEPKIVVRFWLVGAIFAIFGLWLALLPF